MNSESWLHSALPVLICPLTAIVSAVLVRIMSRVGIMDVPAGRSAHDRPVPKGGGVGVMTALLVFLPALRMVAGLPVLSADFVTLWLASAGLAAFSWADDVYQWPPASKLLAQAIAALVIVAGSGLSPAMMAAAFLWLMLATNAINFMDGLNGLISGSLFLAGFCVAYLTILPDPFCAGVVLAAALAGFLPFNFPYARIFLGDAGSQGIGLFFAALAVVPPGPGYFPTAILVPALLSGLLYDVLFTLVRRARAGDRLMQAHRGHLYQIAHRAGMSPVVITLIHWGFVLWGAICTYIVAPGYSAAEAMKLIALLLVPQIIWTFCAARIAGRTRVGRW
ncbi:UDP-phosphate alpha-N-acetylglucosaminephosphotransferase [Acetobacter sp. AN02]|uniref:glycosyltransferase family 4 protein n=1 Tax=Acetobacter sp. AN02 TaxID=2894186 RepID=UPI0024344327|nr:UDP-phosphate alpha-N-acetylglucosaminephosphotransferase [Acetobacter sp. AN02]MDG6093630.1 UDP-phosphate alpha-N-acetylglucosaminephosphotransferase [Acetobacter sp. AN02]